jgi:hypothetical protein
MRNEKVKPLLNMVWFQGTGQAGKSLCIAIEQTAQEQWLKQSIINFFSLNNVIVYRPNNSTVRRKKSFPEIVMKKRTKRTKV